MQNKGIVIVTAVLLTLASIFYLSFSAATKYYDSQAAKIKDPIAQQDYKDSVKFLGLYSYQKCLETQYNSRVRPACSNLKTISLIGMDLIQISYYIITNRKTNYTYSYMKYD